MSEGASDVERKRAYQRDYYLRNAERKKATAIANRAAKIEEYRKRNKRRYDEHRPRILAKIKEWRDKNAKARSFAAKVRRRGLSTTNELIPGEWYAIVAACGNVCIVPGCGASPVTQDHVVPLSKGGRHHVDNLQPLCGSCNSSKGTKAKDYRCANA